MRAKYDVRDDVVKEALWIVSQVRDRPCWPGISVQEEQSHVFYTLNLNSMTSPSATT